MSETIPVAVWEGTFTLFGVTLKCAVLDDGQRVIDAESLALLFEVMSGDATVDADELERFARWRVGQ